MIGATEPTGSGSGNASAWKAQGEETAAGPAPAPGAPAETLSRSEAAALAHRLRDPLAAIHQSVETLGRICSADRDASELCSIVLEETRRLERTVARALRAARGLERTPVDIGALVERVIQLVRRDPRAGAASQIQLRIEEPGLLAAIDADRVSEALWSLLENALDAVAGSGFVAVAVASQHSLGVPGVRIDVRDSGAGFDPAAAAGTPLAFPPDRPRGAGIGLGIARDVATAHGGFLRLRNAAEGGARVSLWLPLAATGR